MSGNLDGAFDLLQRAARSVPGDPATLTMMAEILRAQGLLRDAVLHCDAAIRTDPSYAPAWLERGQVLAAGGSTDAAAACFARTVEIDPSNSIAWAARASISAWKGDASAREFADRALALEPGNAAAAIALAGTDIRDRAFAAAAERLRALLTLDTTRDMDRVTALNLLGDALDRLGETEAAFDAYAESNAHFAAIHEAQFGAAERSHTRLIERLAASMNDAPSELWQKSVGQSADGKSPTHAFLLGYPRSGNTLVENILASIDGVLALEERPTLAEAERALVELDIDASRFAMLDHATLNRLRDAYWAKVAASGVRPGGAAFVDMDPLKGISLPVIATLFPQAKIVLVRRDPRDVVWSCFHTNFTPTPAAYQFTSIEAAARHYEALMRLTDLAIRKLPLDIHIMRYEDLITDFDTVTKNLCAFLDLPWSPGLHDFNITAKARGVSTASGPQVRRALYDGSRQWERYRVQLEPVMPILDPWVTAFGYAA